MCVCVCVRVCACVRPCVRACVCGILGVCVSATARIRPLTFLHWQINA